VLSNDTKYKTNRALCEKLLGSKKNERFEVVDPENYSWHANRFFGYIKEYKGYRLALHRVSHVTPYKKGFSLCTSTL
jgi:hypothetical protein